MRLVSRMLVSGGWALGLLALVGCATIREEEKPLAETTMGITRAGDDVTLSWASQPDLAYCIWYTERREAKSRWNILPGAEQVRGNGQTLILRDRVPTGQTRFYRIQTIPLSALAP